LTGIYFGGSKTVKERIPEEFFFFLCFPDDFFTGTWFWRGSQEFLFFAAFTGFFAGIPAGQEFLHLQQIPPNSSGFLFPPNAVLLWPATKVGFLLGKYCLK
jgi:hypothetical protein